MVSTWEERMAARAEANGWTLRQEWERERLAADAMPDEHAGHHDHLNGTMVECSCGEEFGVTCIAFPDFGTNEEARAFFDSLACRECGKKGVSGPLGEAGGS